MVKEAQVIKIDTTENKVQFRRPDFTVFDQRVLGWNLAMTNDIDDEDLLTIYFTNIPKYNGDKINKRQTITFDSGGPKPFKTLVRDITYTLDNNRSSTQLVLATEKIMFDNFIGGGWQLPESDEAPPITQVFDDLSAQVLSTAELDIDADLKFPQKQVRILGNKNVLDYLKNTFSQAGSKILDFWIDIFGILHIQKTTGFNQPAIKIDYNEIKPKLISAKISNRDRWEEREGKVSADLNTPTKDKPEIISGFEFNLSEKEVAGPNSSKKIKPRTGTQFDIEQQTPTLQNVAVDNTEILIELMGVHWLLPHTRVLLINFPLEVRGTYKVKRMEINDRGLPTTTLSFETASFDMLDRVKKESEETKKEPDKPVKGTTAIIDAEKTRIN